MKPKTKLHHQVLELSYYLGYKDSTILDWAKKSVLEHVGYRTKSRVLCLDCGERFATELVSRKKATCPHCNAKLKIEDSKKLTYNQATYVAIAEVVDGFQVIRHYEVRSYHKANKPTKYFIQEVLQHWYLNNKKREVVALNHTINWNCDSWGGKMEIRNKSNRKYWESSDRYEIYPEAYHPKSEFRSEFSKYGVNSNLEGLTFLEAVEILPNHPQAETLLKAKQYRLLSRFRKSEANRIRRHWPSIKICMRNKYVVKDAGMWLDYLDLLYYFRKDLRNAHYVCPKNIKKSHDKLMDMKRKIQKRDEEERKARKQLNDEKLFLELKQAFFGIVITDGLIIVKALESIQEHKEEGDAMHHCVFTNEYYTKPNSLILSAQIDGKRIETVDVSLTTQKVVQSRGACNKLTEHHDRIIKLVNRSVGKIIRQRLKLNQSA